MAQRSFVLCLLTVVYLGLDLKIVIHDAQQTGEGQNDQNILMLSQFVPQIKAQDYYILVEENVFQVSVKYYCSNMISVKQPEDKTIKLVGEGHAILLSLEDIAAFKDELKKYIQQAHDELTNIEMNDTAYQQKARRTYTQEQYSKIFVENQLIVMCQYFPDDGKNPMNQMPGNRIFYRVFYRDTRIQFIVI